MKKESPTIKEEREPDSKNQDIIHDLAHDDGAYRDMSLRDTADFIKDKEPLRPAQSHDEHDAISSESLESLELSDVFDTDADNEAKQIPVGAFEKTTQNIKIAARRVRQEAKDEWKNVKQKTQNAMQKVGRIFKKGIDEINASAREFQSTFTRPKDIPVYDIIAKEIASNKPTGDTQDMNHTEHDRAAIQHDRNEKAIEEHSQTPKPLRAQPFVRLEPEPFDMHHKNTQSTTEYLTIPSTDKAPIKPPTAALEETRDKQYTNRVRFIQASKPEQTQDVELTSEEKDDVVQNDTFEMELALRRADTSRPKTIIYRSQYPKREADTSNFLQHKASSEKLNATLKEQIMTDGFEIQISGDDSPFKESGIIESLKIDLQYKEPLVLELPRPQRVFESTDIEHDKDMDAEANGEVCASIQADAIVQPQPDDQHHAINPLPHASIENHTINSHVEVCKNDIPKAITHAAVWQQSAESYIGERARRMNMPSSYCSSSVATFVHFHALPTSSYIQHHSIQPHVETMDSHVKPSLAMHDTQPHNIQQNMTPQDNKESSSPLALQNPHSGFVLPPLAFLQAPTDEPFEVDEAEIDLKVNNLLTKLRIFKIEGDIVGIHTGPIVTTFEYRPAPHIKVSRILNLSDDLMMALQAKTLRIEAPVPGKDVMGIEIPNTQSELIVLRDILQSNAFKQSLSPLTLALGKDIRGNPFVTDLRRLPHLLIAGSTGSGKSVGVNAMILSLLYRNSPNELKLVMIDPKQVEFSVYNDIPHLLTPVITDIKEAILALSAAVNEMERRNAAMADAQVRNIESYNQLVGRQKAMPYIVVVIDELADLMMTGGKEVEYHIARLAQMARASGIHLIIATQRPSVDVVTGLIKANLPARISYKVGAKVDSKVILDCFGAESLLGKGDMLFNQPDGSGVIRLHAPWNSEDESRRVADFLKSQAMPVYDEEFLRSNESNHKGSISCEVGSLYEQAKQIILESNKTSISYLQRRLEIGYNKAANIIEELERDGFLSPPNNKGLREIL